MSGILNVQWTIVPQHPPEPVLPCSRCKAHKRFRSSGKFRLNAQGKRLDAWLIYNCVACDAVWNRPLIERESVRSVEPRVREALTLNDPVLARRHAFDLASLRRHAHEIHVPDSIDIAKTALACPPPAPVCLQIVLQVPLPLTVRLDRVLAGELTLSRARVQRYHRNGTLSLRDGSRQSLKRPVRDGARVELLLSGMAEASLICAAALGG